MGQIKVAGLEKFYGEPGRSMEFQALGPIDLEIADREFVALIGPSGCGKSTLLNVLARLLPPSRGQVLINGERVSASAPLPGGVRIGYVFQEPRLLPWLTVSENIAFALRNYAVPSGRWREIIGRHVALVGLSGFGDAHPGRLSGGMRQRAAIARALAIEPSILLMDEPFSGLDELTARTMRQELLQIWGATRTTVLFVTHNSYEAFYLADRVMVMTKRPGRVIRELAVPVGRPRDYDDPELFAVNRQLMKQFLAEWQ
jgi:ABC-type nitrate/sulfonate/bicarbonate transport system ATPase subunit